jgi:hypothetical protein
MEEKTNFENVCRVLYANHSKIGALICSKITHFCYVEEKLAKDIIELQNLMILKFQNPEIIIDIGLSGSNGFKTDAILPEDGCMFLSGVNNERN